MTSIHHKYRFWQILVLICLLFPKSYGQKTGLDLLGDQDKIEIPFSETNGLLMINIRMNGVPLTFIYDTGAENTILFKKEIGQILGLKSSRRIRIVGSDLSNTIYGYIVHNVHFKVKQGIERVESIIILEQNVYKIQESTGHQVDGLLGGNFFRNTMVKIDYRRNKLVVTHPINYKYRLEHYTELDVDFADQKPYVIAQISTHGNIKKEVLLLVDTGSSIPFILHTNVDSSLNAPENVIMGNLGIGLSGTLIGMIGIVDLIEFSDFKFNDVLTNFQALDTTIMMQRDIHRHGIIGNDILRRFTVIVDYFHRKVYLKPRGKYNKAFKYDKSGLVIIASGFDFNEYHVQAVIPGSPADKVGIKKGDRLLSLQRIPVSFRSLHNIQRFFKGKAGRKVRLKVERKGEKIVFCFKLEDMLREPFSSVIDFTPEWVRN